MKQEKLKYEKNENGKVKKVEYYINITGTVIAVLGEVTKSKKGLWKWCQFSNQMVNGWKGEFSTGEEKTFAQALNKIKEGWK